MSALERIAAAIADGTPVDWTTVESSATDEADRALVRELRLVADLASFHATLISPAGRPPHDLHDSILHPPSETSAGTEPSQTAGDPPPVGWGPLRVIEKIGRGTFGDVYRAWDPRLDRDVALKLLRRRDAQSDELDSTVIEEGRLQARVRHPGVITIHGADRIDGRVGLWMELIQGPTLEQELRERGPRSAEDAATVGIELCRALSAVHETGLVHRDVKAQNVIRDETGRLVLGDFGTGQALEEPDADRRASLAGTPLYLAPELFDRQPATVESDLYGLGVLLYHLVTGSFPIRGRTIRQLRQAHRENRRTFLSECRPDLPVPFVRAVERALDPNPEERFGRATDLAAALEECLPLSARTPGASALGQPSPVWSTKPLLAVGGAALILLSVVTFWQWASPPGEQGSSSQRVAPPTVLASAAPQSRRILNTSIGGATAVSPDGRLLVTKLWDGDQWGNLATYDRGVDQYQALTHDPDAATGHVEYSTPVFSANSQQVAFVRTDWRGSGTREVGVVGTNGLDSRVIYRLNTIDSQIVLHAWMPDGQNLIATAAADGEAVLMLLSLDGDAPTALHTIGSGSAEEPDGPTGAQ